MLDWLGCLVMDLFVDQCSLEAAQVLFDALQKAAATVAIVGTAAWAYFRFVAGRTLKRRIEPAISGDAERSGGKVRIVVTATARNVGLAKVRLDRGDTGLRVLTQAAEGFPAGAVAIPSAAAAPAAQTEAPGAVTPTAAGEAEASRPDEEPSKYLARWERLDTLPVFAETTLLEPGEPALDQPLVEIPDGRFYAVRLELWVASPPRWPRRLFGLIPRVGPGRRKRWRATAVARVVQTEARVDNKGGRSGQSPDQEGD